MKWTEGDNWILDKVNIDMEKVHENQKGIFMYKYVIINEYCENCQTWENGSNRICDLFLLSNT